MLKTKKTLLTIIVFIFISLFITAISYGNSAEPPSILIIIANAPDDLEISIGANSTFIKAREVKKAFESYYTFSLQELRSADDYTLKISTGNNAFEIPLVKPLKSYNNIFTLDLNSKTLIPGKLLARSLLLVSLRIILTLAIEAIIFWLFGYRAKKSWIAFLSINLITQGGLNIWLNGFTPLAGYLVLSLIFGEILVFIIEIIAFLAFVKEHGSLRTALYVLAANLLSLFAGGFALTVLPV